MQAAAAGPPYYAQVGSHVYDIATFEEAQAFAQRANAGDAAKVWGWRWVLPVEAARTEHGDGPDEPPNDAT